MTNESHIKAQQAFSRWLDGNVNRPPTPEEIKALNYAKALDQGNTEHNAAAFEAAFNEALDQLGTTNSQEKEEE